MNTAFQQSLALHWRCVLRTDPDVIFGKEASRLLNRNWGDRIPQPGYVGPNYRPGGLAFVSMNPGGGPKEGLGHEDLLQYEALKRLRDCQTTKAAHHFVKLSDLLRQIMPTWKIFRFFVEPVLQHASTDFSSVCYLNLLKWRTAKSNGLSKLYELSWGDHTQEQFELLQPSVVIAIGSDAGKSFTKHYDKVIRFKAIPRVIGNNIGQPGLDAIAQIGKWFDERPLHAI